MGRLRSPVHTDGWNPPFSRGAIRRLLQQTCYCPSDIIKNALRIKCLGVRPQARAHASFMPLSGRVALTRADSPLQLRHQVGALPGEAAVLFGLAAEMAVSRGALVDR